MKFSDARIKEELKRFVYGYSDRFAPVKIPTTDGKEINAIFTGKSVSAQDIKNGNVSGASPLIKRDLTWCDIFYMAAVDVTADKHVWVTRYPVLDYMGEYTSRIYVISTRETVPMIINGTFYKRYPIIDPDINKSDLDSVFRDTVNVCALMLPGLVGDFDGDQTTVKPVFSQEANEECE